MSALARNEILKLIRQKPPLLENVTDLSEQIQTNGFDITIRDIGKYENSGIIALRNDQRVISGITNLSFDAEGFIELEPGSYLVTYNEIVNLPKNIMALGRPRSSLLRCGVSLHHAVWDAGYSGRSQSLLVVYNTNGFKLQRNSRITQLIFFYLNNYTDGYQGTYQNENK